MVFALLLQARGTLQRHGMRTSAYVPDCMASCLKSIWHETGVVGPVRHKQPRGTLQGTCARLRMCLIAWRAPLPGIDLARCWPRSPQATPHPTPHAIARAAMYTRGMGEIRHGYRLRGELHLVLAVLLQHSHLRPNQRPTRPRCTLTLCRIPVPPIPPNCSSCRCRWQHGSTQTLRRSLPMKCPTRKVSMVVYALWWGCAK